MYRNVCNFFVILDSFLIVDVRKMLCADIMTMNMSEWWGVAGQVWHLDAKRDGKLVATTLMTLD